MNYNTDYSKETIAKVMNQYMGQKVGFDVNHPVSTLGYNNSISDVVSTFIVIDMEYKLLLYPLSSITDEHCLEIAELLGCTWTRLHPDSQIFQMKELLLTKMYHHTNLTWMDWIKVTNYLKENGYDLPNPLLDGKTLHEAGLAFYK